MASWNKRPRQIQILFDADWTDCLAFVETKLQSAAPARDAKGSEEPTPQPPGVVSPHEPEKESLEPSAEISYDRGDGQLSLTEPSLTNVASIQDGTVGTEKGEVFADSFSQREQGTVQGSGDRSNAAARAHLHSA
jgi:hypothetical protein